MSYQSHYLLLNVLNFFLCYHLLSISISPFYLENGKIKKIDVEVLRKIAEELDLSLELLMKAAGYNQVAYMFKQNGSSLDSKSTKDLKT